jgi:hypothetical protein
MSIGPIAAPAHGSSQHRSVLQTERHLADGEVEHVCLWSPPIHECGNERGVIAEPRQPLRRRTSARSMSPSTNRATGKSPAARSLKNINLLNTITIVKKQK